MDGVAWLDRVCEPYPHERRPGRVEEGDGVGAAVVIEHACGVVQAHADDLLLNMGIVCNDDGISKGIAAYLALDCDERVQRAFVQEEGVDQEKGPLTVHCEFVRRCLLQVADQGRQRRVSQVDLQGQKGVAHVGVVLHGGQVAQPAVRVRPVPLFAAAGAEPHLEAAPLPLPAAHGGFLAQALCAVRPSILWVQARRIRLLRDDCRTRLHRPSRDNMPSLMGIFFHTHIRTLCRRRRRRKRWPDIEANVGRA